MAYKDNSTNFNFSRKRKNRTFKDVVFVTFSRGNLEMYGSPSGISEAFGLPYSSIYSTLQKVLRLQTDKAAFPECFNACGCKWMIMNVSDLPKFMGKYALKRKWESATSSLAKPHSFRSEVWEPYRKAKS